MTSTQEISRLYTTVKQFASVIKMADGNLQRSSTKRQIRDRTSSRHRARVCRNRNHIRDNSTQPVVKRVSFGSRTAVQPAFGSPTAVQPAPPVVYSTDPVETSGQPDQAVMDSTTPVTTTNGWTENIVPTNENGLYVTRSGRHIKQPQRFS